MIKNVIFYVFFVDSLLTFLLVYSVEINCDKILSNNFIQNINNKQKLWKAGKNFHRNSELKNLINVSLFRKMYAIDSKKIEPLDSIPESFDSRTYWTKCYSIKSIFAQGNCASSYAIVPASVFTDRLCIHRNIIRNSSSDQLLSCCKRCGGGCFGGHIEKSFIYMKDVGLISGGDYRSKEGCRPYSIRKCPLRNNLMLCSRIRRKTPSCYYLKCTNTNYKNATYAEDKIKMKSVYVVPSNIDVIKSEIIRNGPVSASLMIYEDFFNYKSGVYYHTTGTEVGKHYVKIIGWGKTERLKPYWLAINSWGKEWGDKGLFKILQGVDECGIESNIIAGIFSRSN